MTEMLCGYTDRDETIIAFLYDELDASRREQLALVASKAEQTIVTAAVLSDVPDALDGARYDVVVDTAGNRPLSLLRRALTPRGVLVLVGGEGGGGPLLGGMDRQLRAPLVSVVSSQRLRVLAARERVADLRTLTRLIESGAVTPHLDRTFPLAQAADALRYLELGHAAGKVTVTV